MPPSSNQPVTTPHNSGSAIKVQRYLLAAGFLALFFANQSVLVLAVPFYQMTPGEIEGASVGIEQVGTSSISVAYEHQTPFWMFGPEM